MNPHGVIKLNWDFDFIFFFVRQFEMKTFRTLTTNANEDNVIISKLRQGGRSIDS